MSDLMQQAIDEAVRAAREAGVDSDVARDEAESLAAAVAEPSGRAFRAWAEALGREPDAQVFYEAVSRGRRYRIAPTGTVARLTGTKQKRYIAALDKVIVAACELGTPNSQTASFAHAAQVAMHNAGDVRRGPLDVDPQLNRIEAMERFTARGNEVFSNVLAQLAENQRRLAELNPTAGLVPSFPAPATPSEPVPSGAPAVSGGTVSSDAVSPASSAEDSADEEPAEPECSLEELLAELDALIGLDSVKSEIRQQAAVLQVQKMRQEAGLKVPSMTRHLVFVGNPGTGKTTVARLVGGIYKALGLLSSGQLVEVDRSELVAGYLGQTAIKTAEVCQKAAGGVLFIDEAYSLSGDQYGSEAINTLVKEMEDNRDDLVVIVAGYPGPMSVFIAENPGLTSRFRTTITFENYADDELRAIFTSMVDSSDYELGEGALDAFSYLLSRQSRDENFGNGRFCRNVFEAAIGRQAWRIHELTDPSREDLRILTRADVLGDEVVEPGDELETQS